MNMFFKSLRNAFVICFILSIAMILANWFMQGTFKWEDVKIPTLYNFYYGLPLSFVNGFFFDKITEYLPWDKEPFKRAWMGFLGSVILTMFTLFILNFILWVCIWGASFDALFSERNRIFYLVALMITILISSIIHAMTFFKEASESKALSAQLKEEKVVMELNALKANVDPHFLFNSFNVLYGLIDEDPKKAQFLLNELSGIYRYILENRTEQTTPLKEELAFAKKYLSLQQVRFENCIELEVDISDIALEKRLPGLSLQLLLENAVKHNAFNEQEQLVIKLYNEGDFLICANNKKPRKNIIEGSGMGLQNIIDRYGLLGDKTPTIHDSKDVFKVALPLL